MERASTGIPALDEVLGGGLPRQRGYMITGGAFSDKEILAQHIQYASLQRGESGLYLTYSKCYREVMNEFIIRNHDVTEFLKAGKFAIMDFYSLTYDYEDRLRRTMDPAIRDNVVLLADSLNFEEYFKTHVALRDRIGHYGISVVDALSDHLGQAKSRGVPAESVIAHHRRTKSYFVTYPGAIGLHLFNQDLSREKYNEYSEFLDEKEDGTLYLEGSVEPGRVADRVISGHIKSYGIAIPRMRYEITADDIIVHEKGGMKEDTDAEAGDQSGGIRGLSVGPITNFQGVLGTVVQSDLVQNLQLNIGHSDMVGLVKELQNAGIPDSDIDDLEKAIQTDPAPKGKGEFGPQVSKWIGTMIQKAAAGVWEITMSVAGHLLEKALCKYYGL